MKSKLIGVLFFCCTEQYGVSHFTRPSPSTQMTVGEGLGSETICFLHKLLSFLPLRLAPELVMLHGSCFANMGQQWPWGLQKEPVFHGTRSKRTETCRYFINFIGKSNTYCYKNNRGRINTLFKEQTVMENT